MNEVKEFDLGKLEVTVTLDEFLWALEASITFKSNTTGVAPGKPGSKVDPPRVARLLAAGLENLIDQRLETEKVDPVTVILKIEN